jgi:uncharacterized DUF497 family protein
MDVEWDPRKAEANVRKHGVSFDEAATALLDPFALSGLDDSIGHEEREITVGVSAVGRLLLVVHTLREEDTIRIISARRATAKERCQYEEGI